MHSIAAVENLKCYPTVQLLSRLCRCWRSTWKFGRTGWERTEAASVVEEIGRGIGGRDRERKRDQGGYEGGHRENGREARNSRPSTMVEIFIMVISFDFLGLSSGARDFFLVCIMYVWRQWRSHVGLKEPWSSQNFGKQSVEV